MSVAADAAHYENGTGVRRSASLARPSGLNILGPGEIFAALPDIDWLCQSLRIAPGAPTLFAGYGYSGKSAAVQAMALSVATGCRLWGRYACSRGHVLHLDYEQGGRLSRERYHRLAYAEGIDIARLVESGMLELGVIPSLSLHLELLLEIGEGRKLVIVDSWRAAHRGIDENSSEVRTTLDAMGAASEKTGCVFVVLVHAKKPQKDQISGEKFAIRGSSGFFDGPQTIYYLNGEEVGRPIASLQKDRLTGASEVPFALDISDVDGRRGLRIRVSDIESSAKPSAKESYAALMADVRLAVQSNPGSSAGELAIFLEKRRANVLAAVQSLVSSGELIKEGSGPSGRYFSKEERSRAPF